MVKVVFLQNLWFEFMGPMHLSASLKSAGHGCRLFIGADFEELRDDLLAYQPDLVAFPVMTGMHQWVLEQARQVKELLPSCEVILGGPATNCSGSPSPTTKSEAEPHFSRPTA